MKIQPEGPDHLVGDRHCRACHRDKQQAWPQAHYDGIVVKTCPGLVHCEEVPVPQSLGSSKLIYRCDVCGDSL